MFAQSGILDVTEWPAHREPEAVRTAPEDSYTGRTLGARYRHVGQRRKEES
jgi:hypothetical protein